MNDPNRAVLEEFGRLWPLGAGDREDDVAAAEARLVLTLPNLLRAAYLSTSLRSSQQLHLEPVAGLRLKDGVLVFGLEQQGCSSWGIQLHQLSVHDPPVVHGQERWTDEGCTLSEWLRAFCLLNRPFEPPHLHECDYDEERLTGAWQEVVFSWNSWNSNSCTLWTNGEAVLEPNGGLGARDLDALRRAGHSLGLSEEELEEAVL